MTKPTVTGRTGETEIWRITINGREYKVQVSFKTMKTVRLRVVAGGQIRLSAPRGTDRCWLERFLTDRSQWIAANVDHMRRPEPTEGALPPLTPEERRAVLAYLMPMVERWHPVVAAHGVPMPRVTVRRMRSRYGSCSVGRGRITLAAVLLDVPRECAEYVVLHELTHFLYPNHSRQFYQFIEKYMPDWRVRDRRLKAHVTARQEQER